MKWHLAVTHCSKNGAGWAWDPEFDKRIDQKNNTLLMKSIEFGTDSLALRTFPTYETKALDLAGGGTLVCLRGVDKMPEDPAAKGRSVFLVAIAYSPRRLEKDDSERKRIELALWSLPIPKSHGRQEQEPFTLDTDKAVKVSSEIYTIRDHLTPPAILSGMSVSSPVGNATKKTMRVTLQGGNINEEQLAGINNYLSKRAVLERLGNELVLTLSYPAAGSDDFSKLEEYGFGDLDRLQKYAASYDRKIVGHGR